MREALIMVDDFSRKVFVYLMKDKQQDSVVEALRRHFLKVQGQPTGVHFFTQSTCMKSDMGSDFINTNVFAFCAEIGCIQEFSCPGDSCKWQNSTAERRIKEMLIKWRSFRLGGLASAVCF